MVKLSMDLIARGTSGYTKKKRDESMQHYLKRLTHLYLEDRHIDDVGEDLVLCRNLTVLYLYDNKLNRMPNLSFNTNLSHLYLQNNNIDKIEHLGGLRKLTKLYLGGNTITVLEGLDKLDQLQELHVENQKLPPGEKLLFDPISIMAISRSLMILNIGGNNLDSIRDLEHLIMLQQLMAADNQLSDLKELGHCMNSWRQMVKLELIGNPLCHKSKYRDRVIIMAPKLETLDGKEITATNKQFIQKWQESKEAQKRKRQHAITQHPHGQWSGFVTADETGDRDLPPVNGGLRHGAIPGYMMPALPRKQFQDVLSRSTSQPGSALQANGREPARTYSEISPPKYRSSLSTMFHDPRTGARVRLQSKVMNMDNWKGEGRDASSALPI